MTHIARGLDKHGVLLVDVVVSGEVPHVPVLLEILLHPFTENYVQIGAGALYAFSTQMYEMEAHILPYSWNHTIFYDETLEGMPFPTQRLYASDISSHYDEDRREMKYNILAAIGKGYLDGECGPGFFLSSDGLYCLDIDECEDDTECSHICSNFPGGFSCQCLSGFTIDLDGKNCNDVNECEINLHNCSQVCINSIGSYACGCHEGYHLVSGYECLDIDECFDKTHTCLTSELCKNTIGSYECHPRCSIGLASSPNGSCIDVDECNGDQSACHFSQVCINTYGSYHCSCFRGYYSDGPGKPCQDINECLQRPSPCSYGCHNLAGDYECICAPGLKRLPDKKTCAGIEYLDDTHQQGYYSLGRNRSSDTFTASDISAQNYSHCPPGFYFRYGICQDVNECEEQGRCQHLCENIQGSYRCICPTGYQLEPQGEKCLDIDECQESNIECGADHMCFNTRGSYECIETPCPPKYDRDLITGYCILECEKVNSKCPPSVKYSEILAFKMVALPSGIQAYQDLVRLIAYDQNGIQLPNTVFAIMENETGVPFRIRIENGKGLLYTQKSMESNKEYKIKVQAISYDIDNHTIQYKTQFLVFVSVSQYPY